MHHAGVVIYLTELSEYWLEQIKDTGLNYLGLHPVSKPDLRGRSIAEAVEWIKKPETQDLLDRLAGIGIDVEYEMHALSWLLPREMFSKHQEWFRMNENGERVDDYNCCPSNPQVLEYLSERAAELTKIFKTSTGRYHFWTDDVPNPKCHCPKCREMTISDEAVTIYNALLQGARSVQSDAKMAYLAYDGAMAPPVSVKPDKGLFLEFAPMSRNLMRPIGDPDSQTNSQVLEPLDTLFEVFGHEDAQVLDYWLDNSLFSKWNPPLRRFGFSPDIVALDSAWYERAGFQTITSFACFLGEEYYKTNGEHFDLAAYAKAIDSAKG